jgi:hypothetical protein
MQILLEAMFSMWSTPRLHHSTDQVGLVSAVQLSWVEWCVLVGEWVKRTTAVQSFWAVALNIHTN